MMDLRKHTCAVEFDEIVVCRAFGWKIFRQLAPLAARGQHVQHAVDERAAADAALRRQEPLDESVLLVSQIARILETGALIENPVLDRPHARPRESRARAYRITTDSCDSRKFRTGSETVAPVWPQVFRRARSRPAGGSARHP